MHESSQHSLVTPIGAVATRECRNGEEDGYQEQSEGDVRCTRKGGACVRHGRVGCSLHDVGSAAGSHNSRCAIMIMLHVPNMTATRP